MLQRISFVELYTSERKNNNDSFEKYKSDILIGSWYKNNNFKYAIIQLFAIFLRTLFPRNSIRFYAHELVNNYIL